MEIPVIAVYSVNDFRVCQGYAHEEEVNAVTKPDMCKLVVVEGDPPAAGHCTQDVMYKATSEFFELVAWSNSFDS